jgi:hypothetical protein
MTKPICGAPTRAGRSCTASPFQGEPEGRCRAHSSVPEIVAALAEERRLGGLRTQERAALAKIEGTPAATIRTDAEALTLLERTAHDVRAHRISAAVANAINALIGTALRVQEIRSQLQLADLQRELAELKVEASRRSQNARRTIPYAPAPQTDEGIPRG